MTFKNIKFDDSQTMKSLEKLAQDKGWFPEDSIVKEASREEDLSSSGNLSEDIIKLCSALRNHGFDMHATELEHNFLLYKQSETKYDVGDPDASMKSLFERAHPGGSPKVTGITGDTKIETIIDQHLEMLKALKPSKKKMSSNEVLSAVKTVLGRDDNKILKNLNVILSSVKTIFALHEEESILSRPITFGKDKLIGYINEGISKYNTNELQQILLKIKVGLNNFYVTFKPSLTTGSAEHIWAAMQAPFKQAFAAIEESLVLSQQPVEVKENVARTESVATVLDQWLINANSMLKGFQSKINTDQDLTPQEKKSASTWISIKQRKIQEIESEWKKFETPEEKEQNAQIILNNLKKITTPSFGQFKKEWID